jgi:hypothetical protein
MRFHNYVYGVYVDASRDASGRQSFMRVECRNKLIYMAPERRDPHGRWQIAPYTRRAGASNKTSTHARTHGAIRRLKHRSGAQKGSIAQLRGS